MKKLNDAKFSKVLTPLTNEEYRQLENSILEKGCLHPIVVWKEKNILVDGHYRNQICDKHGIQPSKSYKSFLDEQSVIAYIYDIHLARRHFTPEQKRYYLGLQYNLSKGTRGGDRSNYQNDSLNVAKNLAEEHKTSEISVHRAGKYAASIDKIRETCSEDIVNKILSRQIKSTSDNVIALSQFEIDDQNKIIKSIPSLTNDLGIAIQIANNSNTPKPNLSLIDEQRIEKVLMDKIILLFQDERFKKIKIDLNKNNAGIVSGKGIKALELQTSLKDRLLTFISKYYLNGITPNALWEFSNNSIETTFKSNDDFILGRVRAKNIEHSIENGFTAGVLSTEDLINLIRLLPADFDLTVDKAANCLEFGSSSKYVLSDSEIEETGLQIKPKWDLIFNMDSFFIEFFIKAQHSTKSQYFTASPKSNTYDIIMEGLETGLSSIILPEIKLEILNQIPSIAFDATLMREILKVNRNFNSSRLLIDGDGLALVELKNDDFECEYYLDAEDDLN